MADRYLRPILRADGPRTSDALTLGGGWLWFDQLEQLSRDGRRTTIPVSTLSSAEYEAFCAPRAHLGAIDYRQPVLMGILNATPDSFSDGGDFFQHTDLAIRHAQAMHNAGAAIIDIGGESTRPGADVVDEQTELDRTVNLTKQIARNMPVSIDTRKASVARANLNAGAILFNDVSALRYDPDSIVTAIDLNAPVCLMHSGGDPKTMQDAPCYDNVVLDIYDYLADRIAICVAAGLDRSKIIIDPGIGFGKTLAHNLALVRNLAVFHGLGCPILFGASRKRMIDQIADVPNAKDRMPGSIALALAAIAQGAQIIRAHDVAQTQQAIKLWQATQRGEINA